MRRLLAWLAACKLFIADAWDALTGTLLRKVATLTVVVTVTIVAVNIDTTSLGKVNIDELNQAIATASHYERENRMLAERLEDERRRRQLAEQSISALADNIREQDQVILDQSQQLAFFRQLLEERGSATSDIVFRAFDIVPDFRDDHFQLQAVLVRSGAESKPFIGRLELALSLVDSKGRTFEHRPVFDIGDFRVNFRYYYEAEASFPVPQDTEILNAQIVLLDEDGNVIISRTLHEQGE